MFPKLVSRAAALRSSCPGGLHAYVGSVTVMAP